MNLKSVKNRCEKTQFTFHTYLRYANMTNVLQKYDLFNNNRFYMSNLSGLRDINNTKWTQVPGPEIERLLKGVNDRYI